MEALAKHLVLSGFLNPGESFLFQKVMRNPPVPITYKKAGKYLRDAEFNPKEVLSGLQIKELIDINHTISVNLEGVQKFVKEIQGHLMQISHDLSSLKLSTDHQEEIPDKYRAEPQTPEKILLKFDGNKTTIPESKLVEGEDLFPSIETIERLSQIGLLKIQEKKRSRKISLNSEGSALRYLFMKKNKLNQANYDYLEKFLLKDPHDSWTKFIELINSEKESLPSWVPVVLVILINLGVLIQNSEGIFSISPPSEESPFSMRRISHLEESVSGFIPMNVNRIFEVLRVLNDLENPKDIQLELKLGSSSVHGILRMLSKFSLVSKDDVTNSYTLTLLGAEFSAKSEDEFIKALSEHIREYPIIKEVLDYVTHSRTKKFGFMDLAGHFRCSGVSNFNPAKSLSVIRLMTQLNIGIRGVDGESGMYEPMESG